MQSTEQKQQKPKQNQKQKQSKLKSIKNRVIGQNKNITIATDIFMLSKDLSCLGELLGREFRLIKDEKGEIIGFRQLPIPIPTFMSLMHEMEEHAKREQKNMPKKGKRGRKR